MGGSQYQDEQEETPAPAPRFELFYNCSNGGDGSVSVKLHQTKELANKAEESMDIGWGESSVGSIKIKAENGKLFYEVYGDKGFEWVELLPKA